MKENITYSDPHEEYEFEKDKLDLLNLSVEEYKNEIKKLAEKLGI